MPAPRTAQRYHGKPCRICRETERYVVSNSCCKCSTRYRVSYRVGMKKRQPEKKRAAQPVVPSDAFIQPPSLARLMAGR